MKYAETARRVLHMHNYRDRLGWNAVEICNLALGIARELPRGEEPSFVLGLLTNKLENAIAARKNQQYAALPPESADWYLRLT